MRRSLSRLLLAAAVISAVHALPARADDRLCDPAYEDCRAILLDLIRRETVGIDVAFWFMQDARYSSEIVRRAQAGIPVRVLMDSRANGSYSPNEEILAQLAGAGIPMRQRVRGGILHWKMMLFAGQHRVQFSGANYSPNAFVYATPYSNYVDEAIYFTDDADVVHSFMRRFDDLWTDTTAYEDFANVTGPLVRRHPLYQIHPDLNFPPANSYRARATGRYRAETAAIDVIMYRITDRAHTDEMIAAVNRGVRVRVITEQAEYRNRDRLWHSWNLDRLHQAGVQVRQRAHQGLNHQKSVLLHGLGLTIFGSSNWTSPSSDSQDEHNYFTTKPWIFSWFAAQFERKWGNRGPVPETEPFTPLPPDRPVNRQPALGATNVSSVVLTFDAGPFAHLYDIYFGTAPDPPLLEANVELGPTTSSRTPREYALPALAPHTTYYWRVVGKTMAQRASSGPIWSFTTGASPAPPPEPEPEPEPPPAPVPPPPTVTPRPAMHVDLPAASAVVRQPFVLAGWALDAAASTGTGVDVVHVYAYPNPGSGTAPIFVGRAANGISRPDVAAYFGSSFGRSGYAITVQSLAPGPYMLVAFARSTIAGTFAVSYAVHVRIESSAVLVLDLPRSGSTTDGGFLVGGWAMDSAAASGAGVDIVHAYAYPEGGGAPVFLGAATIGVSRPDVGAAFGSRFERSGFNLISRDLPRGRYRVVAFGRSTVTWTFSVAALADITVR
jgi:hypothetical protein